MVAVIEVVWSPNVCIYSKRRNKHKIDDTRFNIYERCVTYDGPETLSDLEYFVGKQLPQKIQSISSSIALHIKNISYDTFIIKGMVTYYKMVRTANNEIKTCFLFCSSLHMKDLAQLNYEAEPKTFLNLNKLVQIPSAFNFAYNEKNHRNVLQEKNIRCLYCDQMNFQEKFAEVNYETIIRAYGTTRNKFQSHNTREMFKMNEMYENELFKIFNHYEKNLETDYFRKECEIPSYFRRLYNKMTLKDFQKQSTNNAFLTKKAFVCLNCYMEIMGHLKIGGKQSEAPGGAMQSKPNIKMAQMGATATLKEKRKEFAPFIRSFYTQVQEDTRERPAFRSTFANLAQDEYVLGGRGRIVSHLKGDRRKAEKGMSQSRKSAETLVKNGLMNIQEVPNAKNEGGQFSFSSALPSEKKNQSLDPSLRNTALRFWDTAKGSEFTSHSTATRHPSGPLRKTDAWTQKSTKSPSTVQLSSTGFRNSELSSKYFRIDSIKKENPNELPAIFQAKPPSKPIGSAVSNKEILLAKNTTRTQGKIRSNLVSQEPHACTRYSGSFKEFSTDEDTWKNINSVQGSSSSQSKSKNGQVLPNLPLSEKTMKTKETENSEMSSRIPTEPIGINSEDDFGVSVTEMRSASTKKNYIIEKLSEMEGEEDSLLIPKETSYQNS